MPLRGLRPGITKSDKNTPRPSTTIIIGTPSGLAYWLETGPDEKPPGKVDCPCQGRAGAIMPGNKFLELAAILEPSNGSVKVIAIDGPAASGKTATGRLLARKLGFHYLDTGIMYRAITWLALETATEIDDHFQLERLARENPVKIAGDDGDGVQIGSHRIFEELRSTDVNAVVSLVSQVSGVRQTMVRRQRALAAQGKIVIVGRDIGTVVLPNADLKVYLTAPIRERAARRLKEMLAAGREVGLEQVVRETEERDRIDSSRSDSPLMAAADSWVLDSGGLTVDQVVDLILSRANQPDQARLP